MPYVEVDQAWVKCVPKLQRGRANALVHNNAFSNTRLREQAQVWRIQNRLSVYDMAKRLGVSEDTLNTYERGEANLTDAQEKKLCTLIGR